MWVSPEKSDRSTGLSLTQPGDFSKGLIAMQRCTQEHCFLFLSDPMEDNRIFSVLLSTPYAKDCYNLSVIS